MTWSSLSGSTPTDLSNYNTNSRERDDSGGVNDYLDSDSAIVTLEAPATKSLVSTSESSASATTGSVGEDIRHCLAAQLPESTSPDVQITDVLPDGLLFLDDGTSTAAFVSNGAGITSSTLGTSFAVSGNTSTIASTELNPGSAISGGPFVG